MTLSDISIKNPVFAWMLMAALMLFGWISYRDLGVSEMPDVDFPVIAVSLSWEGAAPEVMESDVVDIVEDAIMSVEGVREISSTTRQGAAEVSIEFELSRDIDIALQEVQSKIAQAQLRLPVDMNPAIIAKFNPTDQPIMWLGLSGTRSKRDLMGYVQDVLKDRFQTIEGVGDIMLGGYVQRNLRVWVSTEKLAKYELTVNDVMDAVRSGHAEMPAGRIETPEKEMNIRAMGEASTVEDFGNIVVSRRGGLPVYKPIYLKEVAVIEDGLADQRSMSRVQGETAVGIGIRKQRGKNAVAVAEEVKKRLAIVQKELPEGMNLGINFDSTHFAQEAIDELIFTLILSALFTAVVCWIFLGSWSSTLNVLLAIPTSILGTFLVFRFFNFTLNTFTVLGLSLAIGIVVDDAIMVLENIVRHREMGKPRVQAAADGARQITFAAMATTLALMAIFLPVAFMKGIIGQFFFQFAIAISAAVGLSLLEALTLTPMRASQFLKVSERTTAFGRGVEKAFRSLEKGYEKWLLSALKRKWIVIGVSLVIFAASLALFGNLRKEMVPAQDQSMFLARLTTPVGSSLEYTDNKLKLAEKIVMDTPEVNRYYAAIGGFSGGETNAGMLFVTLKPKNERPVRDGKNRPLTQQELIDVFRKDLNQIPDVKAFIQDLSTRGFTAQRGFPVEFSVHGRNWTQIGQVSQDLIKKMEATGLMVDVDTDYQLGVNEVRVIPDRQKALERGVEMSVIGEAINALFGSARVGKYSRDGRRYDVRVRLEAGDRTKPEDISDVHVWNNRGELVKLSDIAEIKLEPALVSITRKGRERAIGIFANVATGKSQADALAAVEALAKEMPEGTRVVFSGSAQVFKESFQSLFFALGLGIIVAYMILASQFNSYIHPFTVLMALPFSITGALVALFITNQSLNLYSMIGLILLTGIVKKNSILLVDFTNQSRREGKDVREALMTACPNRLRPILMTSMATIAAAVPPAMAFGPGAETRVPMAVGVIGGVLVSTVLTLFVVPCVYTVFSKLERVKYSASDSAAE
jgi:hydrophobe/amphiphile efflux-1 (HAE1) family protein